MKRAFVVTLLFASVPFVAAAIAQSGAENPAIRSELESLLHVPAANYRQEWVLLGSFSVRADDPEKGAKELHVVYAEPKNVTGRVYKGVPAPTNLVVPPHQFLSGSRLLIGADDSQESS